MRKYLMLIEFGFKDSIAHRAEMILWSVLNAIPLIVMLVLWSNVLPGQGQIAGYGITMLVTYYVGGFVIENITASHFEESMSRDVLSGGFSAKLTKPISPKKRAVVEQLGWRIMTIITVVVPVMAVILVFGREFLLSVKIFSLLIIGLFCVIGYLIDSIFSLMIVAVAFVFEEARSLRHLKWMLTWLFSGSMFPFEFLPRWLANLGRWLPFKFRYYVPMSLYLDRMDNWGILISLGQGVFWLLILVAVMRWMWNRNIKKYTAVGN